MAAFTNTYLENSEAYLDFWKVIRTISSGSGAFGTSKLTRALFLGLLPFPIFFVPIYRAITKTNSESNCGKSKVYLTTENIKNYNV